MREFNLDKIKAAGTTVGDVYFTQTKLLLPLNGVDAATSTTDSSDSGHSVTFNGTAQLDTAQKKFGTSSLLLDGNSDYLSMSDNAAFDFGSANFTIEWWVRFTSLQNACMFSHTSNSSTGLYVAYLTAGPILRIGYKLSGSGAADAAYSWSPSTGTWYHLAVVRDGTNLKVYVDGSAVTTVAVSTTALDDATSDFRIGVYNGGNYEWYFSGHMDDFRVTNGYARYTGNFTPPTAAHLIGSGDNSKHIVINSSADGVEMGTLKETNNRIAKAWVNFNGTSTVAIRDSYNISSLVDRGTGLYSLNLSTNLSSVECAGVGSGTDQDTGTDTTQRNRMVTIIPESTSLVYVNSFDTSGNADDVQIATAIIFGN